MTHRLRGQRSRWERDNMKNSLLVTCLVALLMVTAGAAPPPAGSRPNDGNNPSKPEKSVPEPATVLLLGAGAAVAIGVRRFWTKRK
jgi:hypothetical protein